MQRMVKQFIISFFFLFPILAQAQVNDPIKIRFSFIGDIMQHGPQIRGAYNPIDDNYNYFPSLQYIAPSIRQADIAIANLELTLAGKPYSGYPTFSAPDELAVALKQSGVDILVTANNHSLDRRQQGLERTIRVLDSLKIPHTGTFINQDERNFSYPYIIEKKGARIALLNYTYGTNGIPVTEPNIVNLIDTTQIKLDLKNAAKVNPDLTILFVHWGWEYKRLPNEEQKMLTEFCRKNGVDMVIGSHPHVLQPNEWDEDFLVVYSLGNFVSNQRDRYKDGGMIFSVEVEIDPVSRDHKIAEAGYQLTWVYKKPSGSHSEYFILPAAQHSSRELLSDKSDLDQMELFLTDSRQLFQNENKGLIKEYKYPVFHLPFYNHKAEFVYRKSKEDHLTTKLILNNQSKTKTGTNHSFAQNSNPKTTFRIQLIVSENNLKSSSFSRKYFPTIYKEKVNGMTRYLSGDYSSMQEAEDQLLIILNETKFKDAYIVEREIN
mgnify:CR=1 FL=1